MRSPKKNTPRRTGKTQGIGDLVNKLIDPALKKRGFASRDILENWHIIAPPPYHEVSVPDQLKWRRGGVYADNSGSKSEGKSGGAVLILRCHEAHRLGLAHDHERIAAAINRYFGYVLVDAVKLSAQPFSPRSEKKIHHACIPTPKVRQKVKGALGEVKDEGLKQALEKLGHGLMRDKN